MESPRPRAADPRGGWVGVCSTRPRQRGLRVLGMESYGALTLLAVCPRRGGPGVPGEEGRTAGENKKS